MNKEEIMKNILDHIDKDDFCDVCYEMIEEIENSDNPFQFLEPMFQLIEAYPNVYFGNPGPLIHFMEKFSYNGYEELLIKSVRRKATNYNVWMMNRAINDPEDSNKSEYKKIFNELLNREDVSKEIKEKVTMFLKQ